MKGTEMKTIRVGTREEFNQIRIPFRYNQMQRKKLREKARTFKELQVMYNLRKRSPVSIDTLHFIDESPTQKEDV